MLEYPAFLPLFHFILLILFSPIGSAWASEKPSKLSVASDPNLVRLVERWSNASHIPIEITSRESIHAIREAAALKVDFALFPGEISPGERSLLSVRTETLPRILQVGWEVPRWIVNAKHPPLEVSWEDFQKVLDGKTSEGVFFPQGWVSSRSVRELRSLGLSERRGDQAEIPHFKTLPLEALVLKEVIGGTSEAGLVFSLGIEHPEIRTARVVFEGEAILPEPDRVKRGEYPLARKLHLVTSQPLHPDAMRTRFAEFVLGATGQAVLEKAGFLPVGELRVPFGLAGRVTPIDR